MQKIGLAKFHPSIAIEQMQVRAYELYRADERRGWETAFREVMAPHSANRKQVSTVMSEYFVVWDKFFLGRTQSRRSRAGLAFEVVLQEMFAKLGYSVDLNPRVGGRPTFVFPSAELYRAQPQNCTLLYVKRSLRERWRQILVDGSKELHRFLATIDEDVSETDLAWMVL